MYLIDTHIFLWWNCDSKKLTKKNKNLLSDSNNIIFFSSVVSWEIIIKKSLGKLEFNDDLFEVVRNNGFQMLPISFEHTVCLEKLPMLHKDPFDRLLVAQAKADGLTIISQDDFVNQYFN